MYIVFINFRIINHTAAKTATYKSNEKNIYRRDMSPEKARHVPSQNFNNDNNTTEIITFAQYGSRA